MKVCPLRRYREPAFPTAEELREHPELLERVPSRWARHGTASLIAVALGAGGCRSGGSARAESPPPPTEHPEAVDASPAQADGASQTEPSATSDTSPPREAESPTDSGPAEAASPDAAAPAVAAPAPPARGAAVSFDVGRGRGSVGCVVIAPPVFLTEDEAWDVIRGELASAGLSPRRTVPPVAGLTMPSFGISRPVALELDGGDPDRFVGFEFLSREDLNDLERVGESQAVPGSVRVHSSVHSYQFLDSAREMAQQLGAPQSLVLGVFYDPSSCFTYGTFSHPDLDCETSEAAARAKSLEDLRTQVRQFVDFLRSQGMI